MYIAEILALLASNLKNLLIFSLPIVGEPSRDLLLGKVCNSAQILFVYLFQVGMLNIIKKPLLQDPGLDLVENLLRLLVTLVRG